MSLKISNNTSPMDIGEIYPQFLTGADGTKLLSELLYHPEPEELDLQVADRFCLRGLIANMAEYGYFTMFGNLPVNVFPVRGKAGEIIGVEIRGASKQRSYFADAAI